MAAKTTTTTTTTTTSSTVDQGLISAILRVCNNGTINFDDSPTNAIKVIVCICLKFIDKKKLVESALPGTFVDWNFVEVS
jgi:hypothetical protein